ncbi:MAG: histidine kinase [Eubacterium sp.]|nr:histidine kinase [Eubacterium sp.]
MVKFKKTIFKKLVTIFIALLVLSYIVTGGFLYYFLNDYATREKVTALEENADNLKSVFAYYLNLKQKNVVNADEWFEYYLDLASTSSNSIIWVVDKNGYVIFCQPSAAKDVLDKYKDETNWPKLPDPKQYNDVMSNGGAILQKTGDFFGFFKDDSFKYSSWLTVQMPFQVIPQNGQQETIAAVYLHTPLPEIQRLRTKVFQLFMISGGVAIFLAIVLVYVFSLRFTKPLKQINNAARIIAAGEFRNRLSVKGDDEIGQLASSFNQMVDDLQKVEEMRRGFIANVSHELRTPMTSIRGFIEGILDGTIPSGKHEDYLIIVRDEINRLNRLVNDLLDLARMEAGEIKLSIKPFDINELIRLSVIKNETLITTKNLEIEANFDTENMLVTGDRDSIERVVINLLHNAVKFSNENGRIIFETAKNKDKVFISIQDNGIGIDENEQKRVWDRFYKSDKSRGKDKTGTGLGLAIVKNIINEHKQEIWVESEIGKGTKFTFTMDFFKNNIED